MQEARTLTNAERCSVFLMEADAGELVAKVFDGHIIDDKVSQNAVIISELFSLSGKKLSNYWVVYECSTDIKTTRLVKGLKATG